MFISIVTVLRSIFALPFNHIPWNATNEVGRWYVTKYHSIFYDKVATCLQPAQSDEFLKHKPLPRNLRKYRFT